MEDLRYAVLIDADNIAPKYIQIILDEVAAVGVATYKRIYGDWTDPKLSGWRKVLLNNSLIPVQQYSYTVGKNSTDSAMIIDAMDILYSGSVEGFVLVSSDSDFTRLAARLREAGKNVIGMGASQTLKPFVAACNQFKYLDILYANAVNTSKTVEPARPQKASESAESADAAEPSNTAENPATDLETSKNVIAAIMEENSDEDGWLSCGNLGSMLAKRYPDFDVRNFGFARLSAFTRSLDMFEEKRVEEKGGSSVYLRLRRPKPAPRAAAKKAPAKKAPAKKAVKRAPARKKAAQSNK